MGRPRPALDRFLEKVDKGDGQGCWLWTAHTNRGGYGTFRDGCHTPAHAFAYRMFVGPIPDGWQVDHLCHNQDLACGRGVCAHRRCVRPEHLEAVTGAENLRRAAARITHCPQGHAYTPENTMLEGRGEDVRRSCRTCKRERFRAWYAKQSAETIRQRRYQYHDHQPRDRTAVCPSGHAYEGDNLLIRSSGERACRACQRDRNRRKKLAREAKALSRHTVTS